MTDKTDYSKMSMEELAIAYNAMVVEADAKQQNVFENVKKFATKIDGVKRCETIAAFLRGEPAPAPETDSGAGTTTETTDAGDTGIDTAPKGNTAEGKPATPAKAGDRKKKEGKPMTTKPKGAAKKAVKKTAKKAAKKGAKKAAAKPRANGLENLRITKVVPESGRREGTRAAKVFAEMKAWVGRNPNKSVADLVAATNYTSTDFRWDQKKGHITVTKVAS